MRTMPRVVYGALGRVAFSTITFHRNASWILSPLFCHIDTKKVWISRRDFASSVSICSENAAKRMCKRVLSTDEKHWNAGQQMHEVNRIKRVSIEGNIAVGKSTFAKLLRSASKDWEVVPEPVSKWQKVDTSQQSATNLLDMMYKDPQRWAYTFQTFSCMTRLRTQLQPPPQRFLRACATPVQVFERSVYSDRYIFALNMVQLGCMGSAEWAVYQDWHSFLVEQFGRRLELEGIIYLKAPPEICHKRLGRRGRDEEKGVELAYLERLHTQHENWLVHRSTELHFEQLKRVPVLVLDASVEFGEDSDVQKEFIMQVTNFFNSI
ncbi:deoxyguanosine kinase, mitochondrial [Brienomyrus brachyistius]|uniref:deoxyguanosine kinase, mitochondrial n=1 Tax=Brienomyrus brachyistius TaxID=42636 RepID=UPI0020B31768|nr:deoxyguanosine kinase, mitochondrial [Brienomyrus brachyistius]XP_048848454.1 deoxyguanosine kinase, mitochondrial [Brienomyrus brachyistius]